MKTQSLLSMSMWQFNRSHVNVMSLAKCFMNPPNGHYAKQIILQKTATKTDGYKTTGMIVLNQSASVAINTCTLEKNLANIKMLTNL